MVIYTDLYIQELRRTLNIHRDDKDEYQVDIYTMSFLLITLSRAGIYVFDDGGADFLAKNIKKYADEREKRREAIKKRILDEDRRICISTVPRLRNESRGSIS